MNHTFMEHVRKTKYKEDILLVLKLSELGKDYKDELWN